MSLRSCHVRRYTEPLVNPTQGGGGGGSLVIRNTLGIAIAVEGVGNNHGEGSDDEWGPTSRMRAGVDMDGGAAEDENGVADTAESVDSRRFRPIPRDVSYPTTVPAGQAIECRLPATPTGSRNGDGGFAAAAELVVFVPGFYTVRGVRVGSRSTRAYPLTQLGAGAGPAAADTASGGGGKGTTDKAAKVRRGLALVVEVREEGGPGGGNSVDGGGEGSTDPAIDGGVLVAELRSNVCLHNASASDVEVDMGATAVAAAAGNWGSTKGVNGRSWKVRDGWVPGGYAAPIVRLAPGGRLALPLSVLASWQLRLVGDATDTRVRPLRLSPALLDPAVPNALRLTGDMERNSICLKLGKSGVESAASPGPSGSVTAAVGVPLGDSSTVDPGASSPRGGKSPGSSRSPVRRRVSPDWSERAELHATMSKSGSSVLGSRASSPSTPVTGTSAPSGAADWVLTVQPSYLITNALPCTLEIEILQPIAVGVGLGSGGPQHSRGARSRGGSDASDAISHLNLDDQLPKEEWTDNASNSDAGSVTSWSTSTTRQSASGSRASGTSSALPSKAAARNPALDLFFLPTAVGSDESGGPGGRDGVAYGGGGRGAGETGAGGRGDRATMPGGGQHHAVWLDSQRVEKEGTSGLESAWKGLVSSGQDAKVWFPVSSFVQSSWKPVCCPRKITVALLIHYVSVMLDCARNVYVYPAILSSKFHTLDSLGRSLEKA